MKDIEHTAEPSIQQLLDISTNLREKFNSPANVDITVWAFSQGTQNVDFAIYVETFGHLHFSSWKSLLVHYNEIIKTGVWSHDVVLEDL